MGRSAFAYTIDFDCPVIQLPFLDLLSLALVFLALLFLALVFLALAFPGRGRLRGIAPMSGLYDTRNIQYSKDERVK